MEIVDVRYLGSENQYQTYAPSDVSLINTALLTANFGGSGDYIEYFIKDLAGDVLTSNYYTERYNLTGPVDPVTGKVSQITLDPEADARASGYDRGIVNVKYNFLSLQLASSPDPTKNFWIKEVSTSRTEIKAARQDLSNTLLLDAFTVFNAVLSADAYYPTFYLNFGLDNLIIGVNAVYIEEGEESYVIFKLYEPLPAEFDVKSTFWVVTEVAEPANFNVSINVEPEAIQDFTAIKGPNFKITLNDKANQTTPYYSYASLFATSVTSSFQQLQSIMAEKGIQINVDYSEFRNFIHFSSATERLHNFVYKLQLIESASAGLQANNTNTAKVLLQSQINSTITNFDGYEYYLYYTSASTAWPKQNNTSPYNLYSVTSSEARNWLGGINTTPTSTTMSMLWSASYYDDQNKDLLLYTTPAYILDDAANAPYLVFLNMIGQHFDNIWIYLKDVTNRYSAENNPFVGISMDQVSEALQSFGIQLYTNTSIADNLYYSMLGINQTGSTLPVTSSNYSTVVYVSSSIEPLAGEDWLTASVYLPPFGEEKINQYVLTFPSASTSNTSSFQSLSNTQITDEIYKRLYHNLAYLLKTRGTERGVKALIATYGVPNDIMTVHEYGGYNIYQFPGIQEISNVRIMTGSVTPISSSVLSPYATVQYYSNNQQKTSINVQAGFSPADSINASITSSGFITASGQAGYFNIMQYIGAPDLQYSSSYIPLVDVSNAFFSQSYTGNTETGQNRYNVWDFIRVIKYYNNSLFKMLKDWVPARVSAETGIVVKSHMLERNKYPRHEPTVSTSSYDADYLLLTLTGSDGGAVIGNTDYVEIKPIQYSAYSTPLSRSLGYVYVSSSDGMQKYTGEFSGSTIVANVNYFPQTEVSSYAFPWTSSVAPSQHGGQNIIFTTYSLSAIFENVTGSVISQRFLDLDYNQSQLAPVNYGLITQSLSQSLVIGPVSQSEQPYSQYAQVQDYNYYFRPSMIPRYSGSYLSGRRYNVYSQGDTSYGDDPVINYNTNKLGLFTQIATSSFLPGKVNATLGYLADVSGGLFELNQNNKNWEDVQNIFKAGTTLTIKQFDNKKYSNQKATDGVKSIYNSGYSYTPQVYFVSGTDDRLYFQYLGVSVGGDFVAYNSGVPDFFVSGGGTPGYPVVITDPVLRAGNIYNAFDAESLDPGGEFTPGTSTNFASYTASQAAQKTFTVNLGVNFTFQDPELFPPASGSYSFGVYNGATLIGVEQVVSFTSSFTEGGFTTGSINKAGYNAYPDSTPVQNGPDIIVNGPFNYSINSVFQDTIGDTDSWMTASVFQYDEAGVTFYNYMVKETSLDIDSYFDFVTGFNPPSILIEQPTGGGSPVTGENIYTGTRTINYTTPASSFAPGDTATFKLRQGGMSTENYTASLSAGSLTSNTVSVGAGGYPYATASEAGNVGWFIEAINDVGLQSEVVFSTNISQYTGYLFVPYFVSASVIYSSSLYSTYGDVGASFLPEPGDKLVFSDFSGITQDVDVAAVVTGSNLSVTVVPEVLTNWVQNPKLIYKVLVLKRYKDEQNVILTFVKPPGQTSYGFTIPDTISSTVTDNINTLQAAVQSQLLSNQANTSNPSV